VPVAISSNRTVAFKLLGDLTGYTAIPVLRWVCFGGWGLQCPVLVLPEVGFRGWHTVLLSSQATPRPCGLCEVG
jgi:hypothetical protein